MKKLHRFGGVIAGVCTGVATAFGGNPNWYRIAFVILSLVHGLGVALYVVLALVLKATTPLPPVDRLIGLVKLYRQVKNEQEQIKQQTHQQSSTTRKELHDVDERDVK